MELDRVHCHPLLLLVLVLALLVAGLLLVPGLLLLVCVLGSQLLGDGTRASRVHSFRTLLL
jgi:hypothetical protein